MKKILLYCLCFGSFLGVNAQLQSLNVPISFEKENQQNQQLNKGVSSCVNDTVDYTFAKTTSIRALNINSNSARALSQYFNAPQNITVHGATFYAYKINTTGGTSITVNVSLYLAGADSLPIGSALATGSVVVDTSFGGGSLAVLEKNVNFSSPVTVNQPYIIVIENTTANGMGLVVNDYTLANGANEWLAGINLGGTWTRPYDITVGGVLFNADVLVSPHVSYDLIADFTPNRTIFNSIPDTIFFTDNSSLILKDRMYNQAAYQAVTEFSYTYDFGDGSAPVNAIDTNHIFAATQSYSVTLTDTIYGWRTNCFAQETKLIQPPTPANLVITEIMYNGPEAGTDTTEFIEIYNNDANPVDINNYTILGVTYTFPSVTLNPGEFYVIAVNSGAFNNVFGFMPNGVFTGGLNNGGEAITLIDAFGNTVDSVFYRDVAPWPLGSTSGLPDGGGSSLILCDVNADNNDGNNWNACLTQTGVIINGNEVLASPGVANSCCVNTSSVQNASICSGSSYTYLDGTTANNITADVSYVSTIPNAGGCDSLVTENITVISIADQTVVAAETVLCATNSGTTITLGSSEIATNYYLRDDADDSIVDGPIEGNGSDLTFDSGNLSSTTTFNVVAEKIVLDAVDLPSNQDFIRFQTPYTAYANAITVEAWIYNPNGQFPWAGQSSEAVDNMTTNVWMWHAGTFYVNDNGNWKSLNWPVLPAGWVHVATTADATGMHVYYNGIEVASNTTGITSTIQNNSSSIIDLGHDVRFPSGTPGRNSNLGFDNFRVWNLARSAGEISANYNNCLSGSETGLVQYTRFNDGVGTTISSLVGSNAVLFNETSNWMVGSGTCSPLICSTEMSQMVTVTVLPALVGVDNTTICATGSVVINGTIYDASNSTGIEVFTNVGANGCDSTVTVALNVLAAVDVTVDNSLMPILSANQVGATYQWVDCDNGNAPISGEMGQTFTATANGNYAVEVTVGGCTETSSCEAVTGVGVNEAKNTIVSIYPNPTNGMVSINLGSKNSVVDYTISSIEGKVIETGKTSSNIIAVDLSNESKGVYFIRINTENTSTVYKLIKQ